MKIVITGIAQGIGRHLVMHLHQNDEITIIGIDKVAEAELPQEVSSSIQEYYETDLSQPEEVERLLEKLVKKNDTLDVVINNAGVKAFGQVTSFTAEQIIEAVHVNILTPILFCNRLLKAFTRLKVINVGSNSGFESAAQTAVYGATKSALINLNQGIQSELGDEQSVFTIIPSIIATSEFVKEFSGNPNKYRQPSDVHRVVDRIIQDKEKRSIIPIITLRLKLVYLIKGIRRHVRWFIR